MKKAVLVPVLLLPILGAAGWYGYRGMLARRAANEVVLPEFSDLPQGPRAKSTLELGVEVGKAKFAQVDAALQAKGIVCKDTSARALMKMMRDKKKQEREEKEAKGEPVDTVTTASAGKKSPMEKNPQVRWSCEDTSADKLGDRARPAALGRALFVFDSPEHPLRHASYRRLHKDVAEALADARSSYADFVARFGEPAEKTKDLPEWSEGAAPETVLAPYEPYTYRWSWADLAASVTITNYGRRGVDVFESVEVPWPVRSDAPQLPADYVAPTPKVAQTAQ